MKGESVMMQLKQSRTVCCPVVQMAVALLCLVLAAEPGFAQPSRVSLTEQRTLLQCFSEGRAIFRFNTFGDEAFWGDTLLLHQAIAGQALGGVGPGVSPRCGA